MELGSLEWNGVYSVVGGETFSTVGKGRNSRERLEVVVGVVEKPLRASLMHVLWTGSST